MRIFYDTNIVLDLYSQERVYEPLARRIVNYAHKNHYPEYICVLSVANANYVLKKKYGAKESDRLVTEIFDSFNILPLNDMCVYEAVRSKSPDLEDALQISSAEYGDCDVIITRDPAHFRGFTFLQVYTPEEFIQKITAN